MYEETTYSLKSTKEKKNRPESDNYNRTRTTERSNFPGSGEIEPYRRSC